MGLHGEAGWLLNQPPPKSEADLVRLHGLDRELRLGQLHHPLPGRDLKGENESENLTWVNSSLIQYFIKNIIQNILEKTSQQTSFLTIWCPAKIHPQKTFSFI